MDADPRPPDATATEERLPVSPAVGCLLSVVAGLVCAAAYFGIVWFSQQGQLVYAPEPYRATRIWILRGVEGRGIGVSTTRPLDETGSDNVCAVTEVRFYMLGGGNGSDAEYCECFTRTQAGWAAAGACPE
jgi:hypothetical protein